MCSCAFHWSKQSHSQRDSTRSNEMLSGGVHIIHIIQMAAVGGGMRSCAFHFSEQSHSQRDSTRSTTFRSVAFASRSDSLFSP